MKRIVNFLVDKRLWLFIGSVIVAIACIVLMNFVTVNEDMTEYLPKNSDMRIGLDIMENEFPDSVQNEGFKIMFEDLSAEQKTAVKETLAKYEGVESVEYEPDSKDYNKEEYTLFVIHTTYTDVDKATALLNDMTEDFEKDYTVYTYYVNASDSVLDLLLPLALGIFLLILVVLSKAYIEVFLLLAGIGFSILINMGTNVIFPSVSDMTLSIASILQLALSIDYSVMMFHRYEQERNRLEGKDNAQAMKNAIQNAFSSISSSAFTTIVGLLVLLLMSFTIGADMGMVMAKGILCSLICVFTVMPTLILWCDKLLKTTNKAYLREKMKAKKEGKKNV